MGSLIAETEFDSRMQAESEIIATRTDPNIGVKR
jgi:hypothetical protein